MNATEMNHTLDFMEVIDLPAYLRICAASQSGARFALTVPNITLGCIWSSSLVAAELQCIVEAMRYERMGGVFITGGGGK